MRRRDFITLIGGAATGWPLAARAEQSENITRIGFLPLGSASNHFDLSYVEAFRNGLTDNGLVEGRNITVDMVWVTNEPEYDQTVIELVRRGARVLVPAGSSATAATKRQTSTVPIVFISVGDPVGIGIVESLSHPGGNATGFTDVLADLSSKLVDFAKELVTKGAQIGYLWHDRWPDGHNRLVATEQAAQASGSTVRPQAISDIAELDGAVSDLRSKGTAVIIVQPSPFTYRHRNRIIDSLTNQGLAMVCAWPPAPHEGALIAYGPDYSDIYRRAGSYISRILKGEVPADLPVQNPVKFQLVINRKTAMALGVAIPDKLIATADEVIE
jgi:putative ABC transport system substrate-binding protein